MLMTPVPSATWRRLKTDTTTAPSSPMYAAANSTMPCTRSSPKTSRKYTQGIRNKLPEKYNFSTCEDSEDEGIDGEHPELGEQGGGAGGDARGGGGGAEQHEAVDEAPVPDPTHHRPAEHVTQKHVTRRSESDSVELLSHKRKDFRPCRVEVQVRF